VEKAKQLVAALKAMDLSDASIASFYGDVVPQIKAADPKDETGFVKQLESKEKLVKFEEKLNELGEAQDFKGALAYVEKVLKEDGFEGEAKQQVLATKAVILARLERFDDALKALDEAKSAAPESQIAPQLESFKAELARAKEQAASQAPPPPAAK
jgi:tetratricopeptide (TPR) repeat protein